MLQHHRPAHQDRHPVVRSAPASLALQRIAPAALSLPGVAKDIPGTFIVRADPGADNLTPIAAALAGAGILAPEHWQGNTSRAVAAALSALAKHHRPRPIVTLRLDFIDDTAEADLHYKGANESYNYHYKVKATRIGALVVRCNSDKPYHALIGHTLRQLEASHPHLGQSILHWLHEAFSKSSRALDPIAGYGWCQGNYWMGENDESMVLDEQLSEAEFYHKGEQDKLPKNKRVPWDEKTKAAAIANMNLFTKKNYDDAIPAWAGSGHTARGVFGPDRLARLRVRRQFRPIMAAAAAAGRLAIHAPHCYNINDVTDFECCRWEICPFLLRWYRPSFKDQDPLGMIWDDFMNNEFQGGETQMDVNAVFAWHDNRSLIAALKRFELYCRLLQAAEDLLRTLNPRKL
jgi:PRTRC genetic system protein F